ncbi:MAG: nicotinamide-nucleotide amidohydrolase family protein [Deltaproteobacteria bacterium]|jgi:PncC family amidohydrolase|nr:nicotinamide-nucleotide amidohydrolase family protein [Deltaproteobacteria bacterium]
MDNLLSPDLSHKAKEIGPQLIRLGATISVAESLTGGLVSAALTYTPGSSKVFWAGVTAYANEAKEKLLGVAKTILDSQGAVSLETALAMAYGVKKLTGSEIALATTGIAGPDGGSPAKPVGLCFVAAVGLGHEFWEKNIFPGSRQAVVEAAALAALGLLERVLNEPILA